MAAASIGRKQVKTWIGLIVLAVVVGIAWYFMYAYAPKADRFINYTFPCSTVVPDVIPANRYDVCVSNIITYPDLEINYFYAFPQLATMSDPQASAFTCGTKETRYPMRPLSGIKGDHHWTSTALTVIAGERRDWSLNNNTGYACLAPTVEFSLGIMTMSGQTIDLICKNDQKPAIIAVNKGQKASRTFIYGCKVSGS
jgi:hypothetical protein